MIKKNYTIIKNLLDLDSAMNHIRSCPYLTYDTETTGLNVRKDKVIGFSFCGKAGTAFYFPIYKWSVEDQELHIYSADMAAYTMDLLHELKKKELLMWNGSFDIRITKNDMDRDWETDHLYMGK